MLPTDLIGAQVGLWNNNLHLINGIYNATKLNYTPDNNNLVLWLTTNLSDSVSITSPETTEFSNNSLISWDILTTTNSLGGFFCFSKCSTQINEYLYVISPEKIDTNDPTGYLIMYNLNTKQLIPPLIDTPYYLNGGTCVVNNNTHLFTLGGYNRQCPSSNKFNLRCNDPNNILLYNTITQKWIYGAILPTSARIDSGACCIDNTNQNIYLFGGYNKYKNKLSNKIIKYYINIDQFDLTFNETMKYERSEFNALVDNKKNYAYLIGGAINSEENTSELVEVYNMNIDKFISIQINALLKSIRWYGSSIYSYNNNIDLLLIIGGHTNKYITNQNIKQNMTDYIQYLTINSNIDPYTNFPTTQPTIQPTTQPTITSKHPSNTPSINPTLEPTINPIHDPTNEPTTNPSKYPSITPIIQPTYNPSKTPTNNPSIEPTIYPTIEPTINPTLLPTINPSNIPTNIPSNQPTVLPSNIPSQLPTWAPFTPSPSIIDDDPFIIEIDIVINCESEILIPKIYPPIVNQIVYDLLEPKHEQSSNLWVKSIIKQSNNICEITIDSYYTTDIIAHAMLINNYVNTTLSDDILSELKKQFNININSNDINIEFNFITIPTQYPTFEPSNIPISNTEILIDASATYDAYLDTKSNTINSFNSWLYGENNLNWIIILVACCILFPFCFCCIYYCNRYQTQKLLREHKKEIRKFQTLSASASAAASPDRMQYTTTYRQHRQNNNNNGTDSESSDDDDVMMDDGDGYTHHISPIHLQQQQQKQKQKQKINDNIGYEHIPHKTDYLDEYQHVNNIINNYNQMRNEYNVNGDHIIFDGNTTTDDIDGSTTDYNINNRMRNNTHTTVTTISNYTNNSNNNNIYNDSDRMEYDGINDDYKNDIQNNNNNNNKNELDTKNIIKDINNIHRIKKNDNNFKDDDDDYLVVKGMGLTPSLVPLKSNEDITISIKRRNNTNIINTNNQFDDYKISADKNGILFENNNKQQEEQEEVTDDDTDNGGDEFQAANSNVFSPPNSVIKPKRINKNNNNNNNNTKYHHTYGESISIVELPPIKNYTETVTQIAMSDALTLTVQSTKSDILKENSNDKQYEDMYMNNLDGTATRTGSNTINTINSEEQHHENTFELK